jgi:LAO/AO transport system kinase
MGKYILDYSVAPEVQSILAEGKNVDEDSSPLWKPNSLAVVCIDPSSLRTGGSILGDKTRMTVLSADPRAFVRPAAAQGVLGGLAPRTDDVLRLLSQQYPLTLLETVGLGQSEVEVQESVDMLVLVVPPGGGDDLQGVKKGIVEVADMIIVTKADGALLSTAKHTAADYLGAMKFLNNVTTNLDDCTNCSWSRPTDVLLASSLTGEGLDIVWKNICKFRHRQMASGQLEKRRRKQRRYWMWKNLEAILQEQTEKDPELRQAANALLHELDDGVIPPRVAATMLLHHLQERK